VGRPYDASTPIAPEASLSEVLAHAERLAASEESYRSSHQAILERLEQGYGLALDGRDRRALSQAHRAFFKDGLDIRFKLKEKSFRRYPSLRELLGATDPGGKQLGFLASESSFRLVQRMERENRVIPVVGDFAGDHAMPALAQHLAQARLTVSVFYVSNVEQYLLEGGTWSKWRRNIEALPCSCAAISIKGAPIRTSSRGIAPPPCCNGSRTSSRSRRPSRTARCGRWRRTNGSRSRTPTPARGRSVLA
jgi:hypothetical protein